MTIGDIDADGDQDILVGAGGQNLYWLENDGQTNFTVQQVASGLIDIRGIDVADVDRDGQLDILSASEDDDTIAWHRNDGNGGFTTNIIADNFDQARDVFAVDFDGDGDTDVLAGASSFANRGIAWYENDGNENFTAHFTATS